MRINENNNNNEHMNSDIGDSDDNISVVTDMSWIDEEELEEDFYNDFYTSPIESIQIIQMLMDTNCTKCLSISKSNYQLNTPGVLKSEEIIPILRCQTDIGFKPVSLLKFSIELEPSKITDFIEEKIAPSKTIQEVSYTNNIVFKETVKVFETVTTLFILYRRKQPKPTQQHTHTATHTSNKNSSNNYRQTRVVKLSSKLKAQNHTDNNTNNPKRANKTRRKAVSFTDDF